jgi:hypothetical protein
MKIRTIATAAATLAGTGALLVTTAAASFASTPASGQHQGKPAEAVTAIASRDDSGGAGNTWAKDRISRDLKVYYLGKSTEPAHAAAPYMYYATITDTGTFSDLPGQLTPNQGAPLTGTVLQDRQVSGPMSGSASWSLFYASKMVAAHKGDAYLVPGFLGKQVSNLPAYATSTWPELAFPAGTVFAGPDGQAADAMNLVGWGWNYQAVPFSRYAVKTVNGKHVMVKVTGFRQHWSDTALNGDGQLPGDGNILGAH